MITFWDIAPCSVVEVDRRFRGVYCLHDQGDEYIIAVIMEAVRNFKRRSTSTRLHGTKLISSPWWWRQYAPLKRRSISTRLRGATAICRTVSGLNKLTVLNFDFTLWLVWIRVQWLVRYFFCVDVRFNFSPITECIVRTPYRWAPLGSLDTRLPFVVQVSCRAYHINNSY
jgi:hypothetical protein